MYDDCRFDIPVPSQLERPLLVLGELTGIASQTEHTCDSGAELNLVPCKLRMVTSLLQL